MRMQFDILFRSQIIMAIKGMSDNGNMFRFSTKVARQKYYYITFLKKTIIILEFPKYKNLQLSSINSRKFKEDH